MIKQSILTLLVAILLGLSGATDVTHAQVLYWGGTSGNWDTSSTNWSTTPGGLADTAWVNGNDRSAVIERSNPGITLISDITTGDFTASSGVTLLHNGSQRTLTIEGAGNGNIQINGASTGRVSVILRGTSAYNGTLTASGGAYNRIVLNRAIGSGASTRIALNGGILYLGDLVGGQTITIGELSGASTSSEVSATYGTASEFTTKTLRVEQSTTTSYAGKLAAASGNRELAFIKAGSGALTLSGALQHSGSTTVEAGTLVITGSTSSQGNYTIKSGAMLRAATTINFSADAFRTLTVENGGILAPGTAATVGTLTLAGGDGTSAGLVFEGAATVLFRLGSTQDKIELTGAGMAGSATGGAGSIVFQFTDNGGLVDGQAYDLISFTGTSPAISLDAFASNWNGIFQYSGNTLQFVYNAANIPEPAGLALILSSALAVTLFIVRRHRHS